jgi:biofilm protein TabA
MILDTLNNSAAYNGLNPLFVKAFAFLKTVKESDFDSSTAPVLKKEIQGEDCFALFFNTEGKGSETIIMEAHKKYIDIQYVFKGSDLMGFKPLSECKDVNKPYDMEGDHMLFNDAPNAFVLVTENNFSVFFPTDVHAPLVGRGAMLKVVVKVKV